MPLLGTKRGEFASHEKTYFFFLFETPVSLRFAMCERLLLASCEDLI
jgi:hypothetical protein